MNTYQIYALKQLKVRYREEELEIARKRLEYELEVIKNMRFSDYFLIVWDIVQYVIRERHLSWTR